MTERALQSLRVLITRPEGRADALLAAIAAQGGSATHIPLLAVVALDEHDDAAIYAQTAQRLRELDVYQRIIAISVNALHFGMPWIQRCWPNLPPHIAWYGIGAATVAAFAEYGIGAHGAENTTQTSEALLANAELQRLQGERVLIVRGVGGREQLATVLRERGAQVDYAECYRRSEPQLSANQHTQLQAMAFDAISVNSAETLHNLWQCLTPTARAMASRRALIVPSARVGAAAAQLGFARIIVADNAGTHATLAALAQMNASPINEMHSQLQDK